MIKIGLDLAVRTVGLAILYEDGTLFSDSFTSKEKDYLKLQIEMTDWVWEKIVKVIFTVENVGDGINKQTLNEHILIIEDLYVGLDPASSLDAAKVHGGVIDRYYNLTKQYPEVIGAMPARTRIGINPRASKAEIQLAVIDKYNLGVIPNEIRGEIIRLRNIYELLKERVKESRKNASTILKNRLSKEQAEGKRIMDNGFKRMSTQIKNLTGIDEHKADAIVLVMGTHLNETQNIKNPQNLVN